MRAIDSDERVIVKGWTSGRYRGSTARLIGVTPEAFKGSGAPSRVVVRAMHPVSLVWLRRDLRLDDHAALFHAAAASERVVAAFVLDPALLRGPRVGAPIVQFFFDSLRALRERLRAAGSDLALLEGDFAAELAGAGAAASARAPSSTTRTTIRRRASATSG